MGMTTTPNQGRVHVPTPLSDHDQLQLYRAFGTMPHAAGLPHIHSLDRIRTVDDVLAILAALTDRLRDAARTSQRNEDELRDLRNDLAGAGRLLRLVLKEEA